MSMLKNEEKFLFLKKIYELDDQILNKNLIEIHKNHFQFLDLSKFINYIQTETFLKIEDYVITLENIINLEKVLKEFDSFYHIKNKMISHTYEEFIKFSEENYPKYTHISQKLFTTRVMSLFGYRRSFKNYKGKKIYYFD